MKLVTVIGARPQFVKAAMLSRYIRNNTDCGIFETLVHTGQHYDYNMSDVFFQEMDIPQPDINLHIGSGTHGKMTGEMIIDLEKLFINEKPDVVLVYGDTNSTLAGALVASKLHIPIAHVEAGLRTYIMAQPEEQNRRLTDHLSTWLFCPTKNAVNDLILEGITDCGDKNKPNADKKRVSMIGDIMYDASLYYRNKNTVKIAEKDFILLTIHRAENTDNLVSLMAIVNAVNSLIDHRFVFPVHPRTQKILQNENIKLKPHIKIINPLSYFEMMAYESNCSAVLTDSGGVQKEAYFWGKPCITIAEATAWVELVEAGWNTLTGADTKKIVEAVKNITIPNEHPDLYGDGHCAEKIIAELRKFI
jgi:UDP-GlcNAc3NAcA epimerase